MRRLGILLLALVAFAGNLAGQDRTIDERGFPFVTNYSPRDYNGSSQVWCAVQDQRGIMLFCGGEGVLEFDGTTWRTVATSDGRTIRSMAIDDEGTVFVGSVGDLGYLASDDDGVLQFRSLVDQLPEDVRDFTDVWETLVGPDGVYFTTVNNLLRWDGFKFTVWPAQEQFHLGAFVNGQLFIRQWGVGLMIMQDDELRLLPGGERFAQERVYVMLPWDDGKTLLGTRTQGLLLFDGETYEPFPTEVDEYLAASLLYHPGLELKDGSLVLNTVYGGAVRVARDGATVQMLTKETGIINDAVYYVAGDAQGDVWLTTDAGISRVEVGSPFTVFDERSGMATQPYNAHRHQGRLYVGHQGGIYEMRGRRFFDLPGISEQMFDLKSVGDELLGAGTQHGVFRVSNGRAELAVSSDALRLSGWYIEPSSWNNDIAFVGISDGVVVIQRDRNGTWAETSRVEFVGNASTLAEVEPGKLWVGSATDGVFEITYPLDGGVPDLSRAQVRKFGEEDGFTGNAALVYKIAGRVYFTTDGHIYRFDPVSHRFVDDATFVFERPGDTSNLLAGLFETAAGVVWTVQGTRAAYGVPQEDGSYSWIREPFLRLDDSQVQFILPEDDGVTWFATLDGLVRYDPSHAPNTANPVTALIRRVTTRSDSVLYGGASSEPTYRELSHELNELHFEFATPSFTATSKNRYQTRLEGFDDDWSEWGADSRRAYTNLPAGEYRFLVRARNVEGNESPEAAYAFTILPPWYETWWAYLLYVVLGGGLLFGFVRTRTEKLEARQRELEKTVDERTSEIRELLAQSSQQATELATVNEVSSALVSQLEFDALVDLVGDQIQRAFNADIVYVALLDRETNMINFPYAYGEELQPLAFGQGLTSEIIRSGKPLLINEDSESRHKEMGVDRVGVTAMSYLGVPISERGEIVGVVSVQSTQEEGRFDEADLRLLNTIAANVGIALQNAESYRELQQTLRDLKSTQEQLVTQEKMASLGQLTAGIAHEIKNPLNFVNNFAELNQEMASDLAKELSSNMDKTVGEVFDDLFEIVTGLKMNSAQIAKHGKRADSIVKNMMQHASGGPSERFRVEVNAFVDEYVGLAYHGMRAQNPNLNVTINKDFDEKSGNAEMAPQELGRVLLNLVNNALYAVNEKAMKTNGEYKPTVTVSTRRKGGLLEIAVADNGTGIPEHVKDRIFEPLFTTKPTGSGTGLGLSLAFDIVTQVHKGELKVETKDGEGTTFLVTIPA